jgi:hypothetical protein
VANLGLTDDSAFYRVTAAHYVQGGQIYGNPKSCAQIANYQMARPNPSHAIGQEIAADATLSLQERQQAMQWLETVPRYSVARMQATELPHPSLNVMYGARAREGALNYARPGHVVVRMTLGQLRRAGGGDVFKDTSSVWADPESVPLIVTLPKDKSVPLDLVEPVVQQEGTAN